MTAEAQLTTTKRQLILHDGLAFLTLLAVTGLLFAVTLFLFRSFAAHRADLARSSAEAGRLALARNHPAEAIASLRAALSYAPNERGYELLLAQALRADGRTEEATNYFLNLWESQPGDGFINLQLARLARQRANSLPPARQIPDRQSAVNYYRAAIFGNWNGDGVTRRRDLRLELADYLIEQNDFPTAQVELQIAASNAPADSSISVALGDALLRAHDPVDALKQYQKATLEPPRTPLAFQKAGRLAFLQGDFPNAHAWLEKALAAELPHASAADESDTATLLAASARLLTLSPSLAATPAGRVARLVTARTIARRRLDACLKQPSSGAPQPSSLTALNARWTAAASSTTRPALARNPQNEASLTSLIDDTELLTAQLCGPPQGDDALLLTLAKQAPR